MNTNSSYQIDKASLNQTNGVVDINNLVKDMEVAVDSAKAAQSATSAVSDSGGSVHRAMSPEQQEHHIDEFKSWLLQRVEEIEKRSKNPIPQVEKVRDLFSIFDFVDLFVLLDTLAGCMPRTSGKNSEGKSFANFVKYYFPPMNENGDTISFTDAKYLYSAGRCGLLHNLGDSTDKKPAQNPQKKLFYTHGTGPTWIKMDNQNGTTEFTLYAGQFCFAVKQAIEKAFEVDSFRRGVNQRLGRQDWIVVVQ